MKIYKFKHIARDNNTRIEIEAENDDEAYLILVHTVKNPDMFYESFE